MNYIRDKYQVNDRRIVIFGAGRIGRSFIGQLFGKAGYEVIFIDTDINLVNLLNEHKEYRVIIKGEAESEIKIQNIKALSGFETEKVAEAISSAGVLAVSVGKSALDKIIPSISEGLKLRYSYNPEIPLDIIIGENMRDANNFLYKGLKKHLPESYPIDRLVGLVETSIGKMVPIMTAADLDRDPLAIYAEPYNTLILDGKAFRSAIPQVDGLAPKDNMKAWVDRKAFIHNLGHATAAYYGFFRYPDAIYMYEVLEYDDVLKFTESVMRQAAEALRSVYPDDFTAEDLEEHIVDLIFRFRNKALRDTIFRVGHDLVRKLGRDDRFLGAIDLARKACKPYDKIVKAMSFGFFFNARDEAGNTDPGDEEFLSAISHNFESALLMNLDLDAFIYKDIIGELKSLLSVNSIEKQQDQ